ncbi:hypothetical protein SKAU_G00212270 [Synaphobranchus kaupii]|uniref:DDE Tnp4 domain-containing protein n=1 Tax=Synaphobranchus kaupii TaxID=118154 RepID=A0A9Q1F9A7_SYNKA|nr:hypothetical protein SKAU_G00212270 [Synaphobranchus kaupii]
MGRPTRKMIQEIETRWNSTFHMFDCLHLQREPVGAALVSLNTDLTPLTSQEYEAIGECLHMLSPFHQATVELSEEKGVYGSKGIPLMNMLQCAVDSEGTNMSNVMAGKLAENLVRRLRDTLSNLESLSVTMATMLDPRFKTHGFFSQSKANEAVTRLKAECATVIRTTAVTPSPSDAASPPPQPAQAAGPAITSRGNSAAHCWRTRGELGDGGYPCNDHTVAIITPYREPLQGRVQNRFNHHHAKTSAIIEQAFGMLKIRWRCLLFKTLEVDHTFAPTVITTCAVLHICLTEGGGTSLSLSRMMVTLVWSTTSMEGRNKADMADDRLAEQLSAPRRVCPVELNEHNYIQFGYFWK